MFGRTVKDGTEGSLLFGVLFRIVNESRVKSQSRREFPISISSE